MAKQGSLLSRFNLGIGGLIIAGVFPTVVGSYYFSQVIPGLARYYLEFFFGSRELAARIANPCFLPTHVGAANLIMSGLTICCLAVFSVRRGERWGWWLSLVIWFWIGGNDGIAMLASYLNGGMFPTPIVPGVFGAFGLWLTRARVFGREVGENDAG